MINTEYLLLLFNDILGNKQRLILELVAGPNNLHK